VSAAVLLIVVTAFIARGSRCSGPGRLCGLAASVVGSEVLLLLKPPAVGCWMDETVRPENEHVCQHHQLQKQLMPTTLLITYSMCAATII
jgi:hypothetical protein